MIICQFDPFGLGSCCYTFEERCLEDLTLPLGDGARKIFLNTSGTNRTEMPEDLLEFLDYVKSPANADLQNEKVKAIDNRVNKVKLDMEVRSKYMTLAEWMDDQIEELVEKRVEAREMESKMEGKMEGKLESKVEFIRVKYNKEYDAEKTAEMLELDEDFIEEIYELFETYPEDSDKEIAVRYLGKTTLQ